MFESRKATINNEIFELFWISRDKDCFDWIVYDWNEYSHHILSNTPTRGIVVQAGGNCGLYPLIYAKHFERVFTFEPDPMNFYCLSANCKNNKIVKFNTALGSVGQFLTLGAVDPANVGMPRIGQGNTVIYSISIDSLNLPQISLIHLDVEGFEHFVLQGATETIKRHRPTIALELTVFKDEIIQFIKDNNYRVVARYGVPENIVIIPRENKK